MAARTKIKILYLTQFAAIGGGETALLYLLGKIDRKKFEPHVVIPQRGQLSRKLSKLKIKTYYLPLNPYLVRTFFVPGASPWGIYQLYKLVQKIKPDLVHLNHLTLAIYAGLVAKIRHIPVVATAHGPWDSYYFYQDIVSRIFVDKILANTPQTAKLLLRRKIIRSAKVSIVPFGIDTTYFKPSLARGRLARLRREFGLPNDDLIVTIVGRLDPQKDHLTFLKAAKIIQRKIKNVTFFIAGSSLGDFSQTQGSYQKQIAGFLKNNPSLSKKVIFGGFIDDIRTVYQASDVLVSSSISESFGLTLAEAASCSLPLVATNSQGQKLIVKNGQNGFLVPPKRPDQVAEKVLQLANNPELQEPFGKFGRDHILKNFPVGKYIQSTKKTYTLLLDSKNQRFQL